MRTITILMASICLSCNVCKNNKFEYTQDTKQLWVSSYKYEAFYGCINEGLQNDSLRIILKNRDLFNPHKTMDFSDIDQARLLGRNIIINAPAPYIKIDQGEENLLKKQYVSDICLRYYASSELNSIAEQAYRAHHNTK